jgi:hypothetical protein
VRLFRFTVKSFLSGKVGGFASLSSDLVKELVGFDTKDLYRFARDLANGVRGTLKDVPRDALGKGMEGVWETLPVLADFQSMCKECQVRLTYEHIRERHNINFSELF